MYKQINKEETRKVLIDINHNIDAMSKCVHMTDMATACVYIEKILDIVLHIIMLGVKEKEHTELCKVLNEGNYKAINCFIDKYDKIAKNHFLKCVTSAYCQFKQLKSHITNNKYNNHSDILLDKICYLKIAQNDNIKDALKWIVQKEGNALGGSKSSIVSDVIKQATLEAIRSTGETSAKNIWGYFSGYSFEYPKRIGNYEIYLEILDKDGRDLDFEKQKLIVAKDNKEWEIQYKTIYKYIAKARKDAGI